MCGARGGRIAGPVLTTSGGDAMYIGLDVGSVATKGVVLDEAFGVLQQRYERNHGQPVERARAMLSALLAEVPAGDLCGVAATGAGAQILGEALGVAVINEVVAQATATGRFYPAVRTIIEIGGEDSKLICIEPEAKTGRTRIRDFAMNALCAAGTGSFLDQQASRLGIRIEDEWGRMAMQSEHPPRIAGRCSVFAKSDMIHLQQEGCPDYDIVAGLCFAMARNFRAVIGKGKEFLPTISFQGGVAANAGMVRAFRETLGASKSELIIPKHHAAMGAIGAVLVAAERGLWQPLGDLARLDEVVRAHRDAPHKCHDPLEDDAYPLLIAPERDHLRQGERVDAYVGVDVGSISTNVVVVDTEGRVLARRYLMTAGRPLEAVTEGLYAVGQEVGDRVTVRGCGTTGSGRYLTGDFIGADIVKNEITAHATAAARVDDRVDTIFEIGGQDSKYVSLDSGAVVDFTMNKVCAAGTGSFIEEQSERLGVDLKSGQFNALALAAGQPPCMGERCTVFIETDINHNQQKGVAVDDICSALCYSIVQNYLNRVVEDRKIGDVIFFQGGTAYNRGVKNAFEQILGKKVIVPPHHDIMGAIGTAHLAREAMAETTEASRFRGFDLRKYEYQCSSFECTACSNLCEVRVVDIKGQGKLFYGSRCGKFDEVKRESLGEHLGQLFAERDEMLMTTYRAGGTAGLSRRGASTTNSNDRARCIVPLRTANGNGRADTRSAPTTANGKQHPPAVPGALTAGGGRLRVGIPRVAAFWEFYPLLSAFFGEMGYDVVPSDATNRTVIRKGIETVAAETCYPIKVAHGHVLDCLEKGVDLVLLPMVVDLPPMSKGIVNSFTCPYIQSLPDMVRAAVDLDAYPGTRLLTPTIHMSRGRDHVRRVLDHLARSLGVGKARRRKAIARAFRTQDRFYGRLRDRGRRVLSQLPDEPALVIVSRPYNGCDSGLNLNIPEKLRDLGCLAIPMDMLPLEDEDISADFPHMYWKYGQRILAAARIIQRHPNLYPVYITNFGCGPDSFIMKFFGRELRGKPCLTLEVDEHSADVGAITRCEAFLDSLKNVRQRHDGEHRKVRAGNLEVRPSRAGRQKVYIPYMDDHGFVLAAAMRSNGVDAVQMPLSDERTIELGRKVTTGKECYPCIITTGDILRQIEQPDFDPDHSAFFMPTAFGPCRFGQYNKFQRMVLDDMGLEQVPIITLDQDVDYQKDARLFGADFQKKAFTSILFVDCMQKLLRETRPYEVNKGETDRVYGQMLDQLCRHVEQGGRPHELARDVRQAMEAIAIDRSERRPVIGVVGEIFVRSNAFTNNFVVRKIEALGGEACLPPFEEWINYIAWSRQEDWKTKGNLKGMVEEWLVSFVQRREKARIMKPFAGSIRKLFYEVPSSQVVEMGRQYMDPAMRGEPILSMGRSVEYAHARFDGIVNLHPFNCMPGTIVNALLTKFQADYDMPILKIAYDGLQQSTEMIRLEAFMHQCRQKADTRRARETRGAPASDAAPYAAGS
jgi:predicted CoA-substrate-specific enzyme activase